MSCSHPRRASKISHYHLKSAVASNSRSSRTCRDRAPLRWGKLPMVTRLLRPSNAASSDHPAELELGKNIQTTSWSVWYNYVYLVPFSLWPEALVSAPEMDLGSCGPCICSSQCKYGPKPIPLLFIITHLFNWFIGTGGQAELVGAFALKLCQHLYNVGRAHECRCPWSFCSASWLWDHGTIQEVYCSSLLPCHIQGPSLQHPPTHLSIHPLNICCETTVCYHKIVMIFKEFMVYSANTFECLTVIKYNEACYWQTTR